MTFTLTFGSLFQLGTRRIMTALCRKGFGRGQSLSSIVTVNLNVRTSPVVGFSITTFTRLDLLAIASHRLIWNSPSSRFLVRWTRRKPLRSVPPCPGDSAAAPFPAGSKQKCNSASQRCCTSQKLCQASAAALAWPFPFSAGLTTRLPPLARAVCVRRGRFDRRRGKSSGRSFRGSQSRQTDSPVEPVLNIASAVVRSF